MRRVLFVLLLCGVAGNAGAWEPDTTHAGLTEGAALASRLNARLRAEHGRTAGWLELLTIAPDRAPGLYKKLALIEPASGVVPDRRGRQSALAWLVAGSVLEGIPGDRDRNHFYDPVTKKGLSGDGPGLFGWLRGASEIPSGMAAPDWVIAKDNDVGLGRFWVELEKSVTATTKVQRDEHLATALLCAGAMLHVLQDVGQPAHVRSDLKEHLMPLGAGPLDRGSRFERLAGFVYGRLGVPEPVAAPVRTLLRDFFTSADGKGLADVTASRWYSVGTLPADVVVPRDPRRGEVVERVIAAQKYASPKPAGELKLRGAGGPDGQVLRSDDGVCLANYQVDEGVLKFSISDACAAEQLAAILPEVGGYSQALLEWLFRGGLTVALTAGTATVTVPSGEPALGKGKLTVLSEDADGRRTAVATVDVDPAAASIPSFTIPSGAKRAIAVFHGTDAQGEELVSVGESP